MKYIILMMILIFTQSSFSQVAKIEDSLLKEFFDKREITPKHEADQMNIQIVSQDIGIWAPQDLKVLFQDSIINKGDSDTNRSKEWTSRILKNKSFINIDSYESGKIWIYTNPLFNRQFNFCVIKISYYCGKLCAFSCIYSYIKDENKLWKIDKMIYSYLPWNDEQLLTTKN